MRQTINNVTIEDKKLSYRRETARQLRSVRMSIGLLSRIVQCTEHCRIADVGLLLDYNLVVCTVSAKKASEIPGR